MPAETKQTPTLRLTESLALRPTDIDDAEDYSRLVSENIDRVSKWMHIRIPPRTADQRRKAMATELDSVASGERRWWLIESQDKLAGTIDLHEIHHDMGWALVGFWLAERFTGRGIMTQSLRAVIGWGFSELGLARVEIQSAIANRASCTVSERLGMRRESIRRHGNVIDGVPQDMAIYAALANNWPPNPPDKPLPNTVIEVDHEIRLRRFSDADQKPMWRAIEDGREYLGQFMPWVEQQTSYEQHSADFKRRLLERDFLGREASYIVEYQGKLAGTVGFHQPSPQNSVEIGYWLREELQGRGIMTKCVSAVINMAIVEMGMHRIVIRAATSNLPSRAVPERLGFSYEGTQRDSALVKGGYLDLEVYSILDHEWLARSKNA